MKTEFIDKELSPFYSLMPAALINSAKSHNGKTYTLVGTFEKTYSLTQRFWLGISVFAKTFFSAGLGLFSKNLREDWKALWNGKILVVIYSSSSFVSNKILALWGDANGNANCALGRMYLNGEGVKQSDVEALWYYEIAASKDNVEALFSLGFMFREGKGVPQSDETAMEYFRLAANKGDARAQGFLGYMYEKGRGVAQSNQEAVKYYQLAADKGNPGPKFRLERLLARIA